MAACVIFGGSGYIGLHLASYLLSTAQFDRVHLADISRPARALEHASASITDVRHPIPSTLVSERPTGIFNLAAVHREPGHAAHEYFDTNLYGLTTGPTAEDSRNCPTTPYGGSKYPAELIHEAWLAGNACRRLVICRPGVVYGPGDPGNMLRMIKAIQRGYFAYPGSPNNYKSYAYIFGLLESIDFAMRRDTKLLVYNYVESPTESLGELVRQTKAFLKSSAPVLRVPLGMLCRQPNWPNHLSGRKALFIQCG